MIEHPVGRNTTTRKGALRWASLLLAILWLATGISSALVRQAGLPEDFDASGGLQIGLPAGVDVPPARAAAIDALAQSADGELSIRYNGLTLTPRSLSAKRSLSGPAPGAPEFVARDFLRQHKAVWGFSETNIDALTVSTAYTDRHNGLSHVYFGQTVGGTPVFIGVIGVHLDGAGRVLSVQGDAWPQLSAPAPASIGPLAAATLAADSLGVTYSPQAVADDGKQITLTKGPFRDDVTVSEWVYPLAGTPVRTQRVLLHKNGLEWYDMLVHAETGEVLHRRNLYQFLNGEATPSNPPEASPAAPRGLVYLEHPLQTVRGTGDLPRAYPLTGDPTGRPRGFANAPLFGADVTPTNANGANPVNATIDQILLPFPGVGSALRSNALPLSTSPQSPSGWFTPVAGQYVTIGNNVDAKDDQADDNEGSIGMRANGGTTGDFSGPAFLYQNFYAQNGPYASEGTLQPSSAARRAGAAPDLNPSILTLFYGNNFFHDILYHLGFTEAAGNFQNNNFGRGGLGGDYVLADAQDGSGTNNANFGTPADGSSPRMQQFLFSSPERDGTMDVDVIIHEYAHGLSNRLVGGPNNVDCLNVTLVGEGGGMGEGWGDWYGAMIADEPAVGEFATGNGNIAIRRFPMDRGPDDFTYGRICTGPTGDPTLTPCVVHDIGEFWSINLWEMREAMINRFHNRTFPGQPFATFDGTGGAAGNIQNADGRTTDGSGDPAMTDFASIESAAFTAMFRVTDGMKLAPCNPTIADMRDAILAADRAAGGEFQDVIWRSFANRGVGTLATSTGGTQAGIPVVAESFDVPATVEECETAGGPLGAPAFTLTSAAANEVTIDIVANGAAEYVIYRNSVAAGSAIDPAPYVEIGRTSGTTFTDTGVDGVEHFYRVHALRNDDCVSAAGVDSIIPMGGTLDCSLAPSFDGLARVLDVGDCTNLLLEWGPAVSNCPVSGPGVTFSVYRSDDPAFTPDNTTRIASGVAGNTFLNAPGVTETVFYYIVRAEDSTTGHGGPTGGNQESNTKVRSSMVTSGELVNQGFADDVESGADDLTSAHFTSSGRVVPMEDTRGGWYRDAAPSPVTARSGDNVWHTFNPDNSSFSTLTSDTITITPESILTFWHTFQTEAAFDGGVLEIAAVDGITGLPGTWEDAGALIYENGYNGALDAPENTNPYFNRPAFTGGVLGPMHRTRAFLGSLVPSGTAEIQIRFVFASDVANLISVPPTTEGTFIPGWYIDDISVDESCCPISASPTGLNAVASADSEITLTWNAPAGGSIDEYRIFRAEGGDTLPASVINQLAVVPGTQTSYVDNDVTPGVTYIYVVRAIPSSGCPSGASNADSATAFGDTPLVRKAPALDPVADDATPDQTGGVDRDGNYVLSWAYPSDGATPCGYQIEEATGFATQFSDDAEEGLTLGSNSTWSGDPTWSSDTHPDTGTNGYTPLYIDSQDASLTLASPLTAGAGATFSFDSFEDIEDGFDAGFVEVSADGGAFVSRLSMTGTFSGRRQVDLSAFEGQDILVRFRLASDEIFSVGQYLGWFIDNIALDALNFTSIATVPATQTSLEISGRGDGDYSYRVTALFGGACDETGPYSNQEEIKVALNPDEPLPPNAGTDNATTPEGTSVVIDVLANDSDPNGDSIAVASVTQGMNGSVVDNFDGTVTYTPNAGFSGSDTFTYEVCDPGPLCDTGRVFVTVTAVDDPCIVPGVEVNTDDQGDTNATWDPTNDPSLDILSISIAEPFLGTGVEQVVVTLQLLDFETPHPSAAWRVVWTAPDALQYFVSIQNCNAVNGVQCNVGTFEAPLYSTTGPAAGCEYTADGTITITANKSDVGINDSTDAGLFLSTIEGHAQVFIGGACSGLLEPADDSTGLNYEIQTNEACGDQCPEDPNKTDPGDCGCGVADTDSDGDGTADCIDNCPADPNKTEPGDCGCGNADTDTDNDGTADCIDNCPSDPNKTDPGTCGCGVSDADSDGDGTPDCLDNCPNDAGKTEPGTCGCGVSDADSDGDGTPDCLDDCPADPAKTDAGICGCGTADTDTDGDGTADCNDACSADPNKTDPGTCGCGVSDVDTDGDGTADCLDDCPADSTKTEPGDCGCGTADTDSDSDGNADCNDNCPTDPNKTEPGDCGCGEVETDSDGDGTADCADTCPADSSKTEPGDCGCGNPDTDTDGDGTADCIDNCPNDGAKTDPGTCGCGVSDADSDGDGTADCNDECPADPGKTDAGICGCGVSDDDTDGDGTADCNDACPADADKTDPGTCGCGVSDVDSDGDGTADCFDDCPADPTKTDPGTCGCGTADTDSDNDGTADCNDECPADAAKVEPGDCGCGAVDTDSDGDGAADCIDTCPADPSKTEPGDCGCGNADTDSDGDGAADCIDNCPADPAKTDPGACGCGTADTDSDGDGTADCNDSCPADPSKIEPGVCGCGTADTDSDGDGAADCNDSCPADPDKILPGTCGCGVADTDSDGDGAADCNDACPADPDKIVPGTCGCGNADTDTDGDGTADCNDECPSDPDKTEKGDCGCGVPEGTCEPVQGQGRVHGSGYFLALGNTDDDDSDSDNINFTITAQYKKDGELKGMIKLKDRGVDVRIEAVTITSLSAGSGTCNGTATSANGFEFTADGTLNSLPATFRVCGDDLGNPGNNHDDSDSDSDSDNEAHFPDRVYIECLTGCTYNTATRTADDVIDGGNVKVKGPIVAASGGAKSASIKGGDASTRQAAGSPIGGLPTDSSQNADGFVDIAQGDFTVGRRLGMGDVLTMPQTLELDPVLATSLPAGTPMVLTTTAIAPETISAEGRGVTLRWRAADGTRGKVTATIDALGLAVFPITVQPGNTVYHVRIGQLGSNRVVITGTGL